MFGRLRRQVQHLRHWFIQADVVLRRVISDSSIICFRMYSIKLGESDKRAVDVGEYAGHTKGIAVLYESCKRYCYVIVSRLYV